MTAPTRIFISYRRDEDAMAAGWLVERLAGHFGKDQVFKDVDSIQPGDDFVKVIADAVGRCDVLLALIGRQWLTITGDDGRRRLDDPQDFMRLEIEAAFKRDVHVIPVLIEGTPMPRADQVPPSLAALVTRQALYFSAAHAEPELDRLIKALDGILAEVQAHPLPAETPGRDKTSGALPNELEPQTQFHVVTLSDRSAVTDADLPLTIEGRYSGDMGAAVRVILEDSYGQYYVQNPEAKFFSDGTWRATNILPGDGIMYVHFVALDSVGKRFFDQMVERRAFGAFRDMPADSQVLRSVRIDRMTRSTTGAEAPEEVRLIRVTPDAGKRDQIRRHPPKASASRSAFVSYSQRDEPHRQRLDIWLAQLRRNKLISVWHDRKILPGQEWDREIDKNLESADIVLLLVSPDFLASDYAYGREMLRALERHRSGSATVVPIILRPSDWQNSPLSSLQALPSQGRPVSSWSNRDQAWLDVVQGLRRLISGQE
jgi:hypothetical protein